MPDASTLRLALAQINPTVGDVEGNTRLASESIAAATAAGAQLVVLPELCLSGYPPEDLVLRRDFLDSIGDALHSLAAEVEGITALVGFPERIDRPEERRNPIIDAVAPPAHNSLAVLAGGEVTAVYRKTHLPNYAIFDERRYFEPGPEPLVIDVDGVAVGLTICEDIWIDGPPESEEAAAGARMIVNASGSPYARGKGAARERMIAERARTYGIPFALCNTVGGQDELVFDGQSVVVSADGETIARGAQFEPELVVCDVPLAPGERAPNPVLAEPLSEEAEVYAALTLGVRDYANKNGFDGVVLGLSGGIDSALVAQVAADAVGPDRVRCVVMPSPHSSDETQADARAIALNIGAELIEIPIAEPMSAYERVLADSFAGTDPGLAEENLQARIRGNLLMALSNKFGWLVLTTGNKSEMSVGYATLYGDMAGGFAVLKDVWKTLVYRLVRHRNERASGEREGTDLVPASVLDRAPSAELKPDQRDEDSLPPYELLDRVLEGYVERDEGRETLVSQGLDAALVDDVIRMVDRAEYKRRQAAPGIRVSTKAFGRDRRLPITNRFTSMRPLPR